MLRSMLCPNIYRSSALFLKEREVIFKNLWIFAGIKKTLSKKNAFLTRNIGSVPVVITTPDGVNLKAFENICRHRLMPIHQQEFGNRSLTCPYHEWSFNSDGHLRGMPNAHLYDMCKEKKEQLSLRQFAVETIGSLIFVNLSTSPLPIEKQFTPEFFNQIKEASEYFDNTYIYTNFDVNYNWKFNFENVMDYNHVPFVHAGSFGGLLRQAINPADAEYIRWEENEKISENWPVDSLSYAGVGKVNIPDSWYSSLVRRYGELDSYYNWFIFPNVNFASVVGSYFYLQQFEPLSEAKTRLHLWVVPSERLSPRTDFTALMRGIIEGEKKVIDEDIVLMENLQRALHDDIPRIENGAYETRLIRFGKWYKEHVLSGASGEEYV